MAWKRSFLRALDAGGCPPPPMQPFGQAITSMKSKYSSPLSTFSMSLSALPRPFATAIFKLRSPALTWKALMPSRPRTPHSAIVLMVSGDASARTRRMTASVTPPVTPKMTPAPVQSPRGSSGSESGRFLKSMPAALMSLPSSSVVRTRSMRRFPSFSSSGRWASNFFAVQGIIATE